ILTMRSHGPPGGFVRCAPPSDRRSVGAFQPADGENAMTRQHTQERRHDAPAGRYEFGERPRPGASPPENYQCFFVPAIGAPVARELADAAELRPGERVLDVGCGTGVVARLAAARVGATGSVVGLDIHPGMLAVAAATDPGGSRIGWCEADAESIPFPERSF